MTGARLRDDLLLDGEATALLEALGDASEALELLVLFGSLASAGSSPSTGERAPRDVDLGVLVRDPTSIRDRWRLEAGLVRIFAGQQLDLIDLGTAPPLLRFEIARGGQLLFERRPFQWADFRARAMVDWWDWAPYQRRMDRAAVRALREAPLGPP